MADQKQQRRSAFEDFLNSSQPAAPGDTPGQPQPPSVLDQLKVAERKKRDRGWDARNRPHSYRGIPQDIQDQVVALAAGLQVTADEVAQACLQHGLSSLKRGTITISPRPKAQRMTLFPLPSGWGDQSGWTAATGWDPATPRAIPGKQKSRSKKTEEDEPQLWQRVVAYRIADNIHAAIKTIADQHAVPVGEVVTLFLQYGLEQYKAGRLQFSPQPRAVKKTLVGTAS